MTEPIPSIESFDPATVPFDSRTLIRITGDHFIGASTAPGSVFLTDVLRTPLEELRIIDRYNMEAVVPQGVQVDRYQLVVTNKKGQNTTSALLTVRGSSLSLGTISPNTDIVSGGAFLTVTGSGFVQGTRLVIGNSLAQDILVQPEKLEAFVPPLSGSIEITGSSTSVRVELFNPDGEKVGKNTFFTYFSEQINPPKIGRAHV